MSSTTRFPRFSYETICRIQPTRVSEFFKDHAFNYDLCRGETESLDGIQTWNRNAVALRSALIDIVRNEREPCTHSPDMWDYWRVQREPSLDGGPYCK